MCPRSIRGVTDTWYPIRGNTVTIGYQVSVTTNTCRYDTWCLCFISTRAHKEKDTHTHEKVPVTQTLSFCQMHFLSPLPVAFDRKLVSVIPVTVGVTLRGCEERHHHRSWLGLHSHEYVSGFTTSWR